MLPHKVSIWKPMGLSERSGVLTGRTPFPHNSVNYTYCKNVLEADEGRLRCWWSLSTLTPSAVSTMLRLRRVTSLPSSALTTSAGDVMTTGGAACIRTPPLPPPAAEAADSWDVGSRRRTSLLLGALVIDTDGGVNGFKLYINFSAHTKQRRQIHQPTMSMRSLITIGYFAYRQSLREFSKIW